MICIGVLPCMYVCVPLVPLEARSCVPEGYELPYRCGESNPSPLKEQSVLLTAEPPLQPGAPVFNVSIFGDRVCRGYLEQSKGTMMRLCSDRSGVLIKRGQDLSPSFVFES